MRQRDLAELMLLAAIWGASFLFMKLGAAEFGAVALAAVRVTVAAAVLLPLAASRGLLPQLRAHWRAILFVGTVNSALPFVAFGWAVLTITAGTSSVLNSTAPLWAALIAWAWLGDRLDRWRVLGIVLGFVGVLALAWDKVGVKGGPEAWQVAAAVAACLGATLCYGYTVNYTKQRLAMIAPLAQAAGSQAAASVVLIVPALWFWPAATPGATAWAAALTLALLCSALAYLLYFRLIAHLGPARAITVTYLIPLFGVAWGALFLGETISTGMVAAGAVILLGTALATGLLKPRQAAPA